MKVYVITSGSYSDYGIRAVSVDKNEAERICATLNDGRKYSYDDNFYIEEYDTDEIKVETLNDVKISYEMSVKYSDLNVIYFEEDFATFKDINKIEIIKKLGEKRIMITSSFTKDIDRDKAKRIMLDRIAKFKAEREGIA